MAILVTVELSAVSNSYDEANNTLTHASTFYWLGRYKNINPWDFFKTKIWYNKALIITDSDSCFECGKLR